MNVRENIDMAMQSIRDVNGQIQMLKDIHKMNIEQMHELNPAIDKVLDYVHYKKLRDMSLEGLQEILTEASPEDNPTKNYDVLAKAYAEIQESDQDKSDIPDLTSYIRKVLVEIKDSILTIYQMEFERDQLKEEMNGLTADYVKANISHDMKMQQLAEMREEAENDPDPINRAKTLQNIAYMTSAESLEFLLENIKAETPPRKGVKVGQAEIDNIVDIYLSATRSSMVLNKFKSRLPRFGYDALIYRKFFNIEENFLPEEYHKFNNLFLFHVMRTISFMDTSNKVHSMYASTILLRLYNLVYHQYEDDKSEKEFLEFIQKFLDYFKDKWGEYFEKNNLSAPNNPATIEMRERAAQKRRMYIIDTLVFNGVDVNTELETSELEEQLKKFMEEKEANRKAEVEEWENEKNPKEDEEILDSETSVDEDIDDSETSVDEDTAEESEETSEDIPENIDALADALVDTIENSGEETGSLQSVELMEKTGVADEMDKLCDEVANDLSDETISEVTIPSDKVSRIETRPIVDGEVDRNAPYWVNTECPVYVDQYGYYYMHTPDDAPGMYNYYTKEDEIHEKDIKEETVLQLLGTGNLRKEMRVIHKKMNPDRNQG